MSDTKLEESVTCPYCNYKDWYKFHYGMDSLFCNKCDKEFAIKIETVVRVKSARIYDRLCIVCGKRLFEDEIVDGKCPECGCGAFEDNMFNDSEFDFKHK